MLLQVWIRGGARPRAEFGRPVRVSSIFLSLFFIRNINKYILNISKIIIIIPNLFIIKILIFGPMFFILINWTFNIKEIL
jgi:hypothetical protein